MSAVAKLARLDGARVPGPYLRAVLSSGALSWTHLLKRARSFPSAEGARLVLEGPRPAFAETLRERGYRVEYPDLAGELLLGEGAFDGDTELTRAVARARADVVWLWPEACRGVPQLLVETYVHVHAGGEVHVHRAATGDVRGDRSADVARYELLRLLQRDGYVVRKNVARVVGWRP